MHIGIPKLQRARRHIEEDTVLVSPGASVTR